MGIVAVDGLSDSFVFRSCNATRVILLPVSQWRVTPKDVMSVLGAVPTKNQRGLGTAGTMKQ